MKVTHYLIGFVSPPLHTKYFNNISSKSKLLIPIHLKAVAVQSLLGHYLQQWVVGSRHFASVIPQVAVDITSK